MATMIVSVSILPEDLDFCKRYGLKLSHIVRQAIKDKREQLELGLEDSNKRIAAMHNTIKRLTEVLEKHGVEER